MWNGIWYLKFCNLFLFKWINIKIMCNLNNLCNCLISIFVDFCFKYCLGKVNIKKKMIMKFGFGKKYILRLCLFECCKN